jgi:hypothetical protein
MNQVIGQVIEPEAPGAPMRVNNWVRPAGALGRMLIFHQAPPDAPARVNRWIRPAYVGVPMVLVYE